MCICFVVVALLLVVFVVPFVLAQNSFGTGYGWYIGNATPIPTPKATPTLTVSPTSQAIASPTVNSTVHSSETPGSFSVSTPSIPEENPLLVLAIFLILGLVGSLVFKVGKQKKLNLSKITLLVSICFICFFFYLLSLLKLVMVGKPAMVGMEPLLHLPLLLCLL